MKKRKKPSRLGLSEREEAYLLRLLSDSRFDFAALDGGLTPLIRKFGEDVYSRLIFLVSHLRFPPKTAKRHYAGIKKHHAELVGKLDREIDIRIAFADYFVSSKQIIKDPMVLEIHLFKQAQQAGLKDTLTGLFNYTFLKAAYPHELAHSKRYIEPLTAVFFDLDNFKKINDVYGHEAANGCLRKVAELIRRSVREMDIAFRYGGEEFLLLLPKTDKFGALAVAERIRKTLAETGCGEDDRKISMTVSGGVASFPVDDDTGENLIQKADEAMYRAKAKGKNRIELYSVERRAYERYEDNFKGILSMNGISCPVFGKNISLGGFYIEAGKRLPLSSKVEFTMDFSLKGAKGHSVSGNGIITRCEPHPSKKWGIGIAVTGMQKEDRELLKRYIMLLTPPLK